MKGLPAGKGAGHVAANRCKGPKAAGANGKGVTMEGSVNKVILIGNLGADPEIRRTQDGRPIANLRVATSETWRDRNTGERREKTEWHNVVVFSEGLVKVIEQYVRKGSKLYIEGQLQTRKWQDRDGNDRYTTEVVLQNYGGTLTMLDSQRDRMGGGDPGYGGGQVGGQGGGYDQRPSYGGGGGQDRAPAPAGPADMDDDIPF